MTDEIRIGITSDNGVKITLEGSEEGVSQVAVLVTYMLQQAGLKGGPPIQEVLDQVEREHKMDELDCDGSA